VTERLERSCPSQRDQANTMASPCEIGESIIVEILEDKVKDLDW
jgi:hypothetical protein